jgi:hypothetical protein
MRPVAALLGIALGVLVACQGADPTSPTRELDPSGKKVGAGGGSGGGKTGIVLSGGYSSVVGTGGVRTKGRSATFDTPVLAPFSSAIKVDTDGGAPGPNQLPLSGQLIWSHCIWNADVASPYDPSNVPEAAKELWDEFFQHHATARPRLFFALVDLSANGAPSWNHQSLLRWFSSVGSNNYMWEFEAGGERNLSLVQPVGSFDGQRFTFRGGIVRVTRTLCDSSSDPDGCVPARGKGNRPTVVCRNDGLAFPAITYAAEIQ